MKVYKRGTSVASHILNPQHQMEVSGDRFSMMEREKALVPI